MMIKSNKKFRGVAISVVLLVIVMVMIFVFALSSISVHNLRLVKKSRSNDQALYAAEAGIRMGLYQLSENSAWKGVNPLIEDEDLKESILNNVDDYDASYSVWIWNRLDSEDAGKPFEFTRVPELQNLNLQKGKAYILAEGKSKQNNIHDSSTRYVGVMVGYGEGGYSGFEKFGIFGYNYIDLQNANLFGYNSNDPYNATHSPYKKVSKEAHAGTNADGRDKFGNAASGSGSLEIDGGVYIGNTALPGDYSWNIYGNKYSGVYDFKQNSPPASGVEPLSRLGEYEIKVPDGISTGIYTNNSDGSLKLQPGDYRSVLTNDFKLIGNEEENPPPGGGNPGGGNPGGGNPGGGNPGGGNPGGDDNITKIILDGPGTYVFSGVDIEGQNHIEFIYEDPDNTNEPVIIIMDGNIKAVGNSTFTFQTIDNVIKPGKIQVYGTSNCLKVDIGGTPKGGYVLYAPDAAITFRGASNHYGALWGKTVTISGHAGAIWYDIALRDTKFTYLPSGESKLVRTSWQRF
jgi:hypothetical protein